MQTARSFSFPPFLMLVGTIIGAGIFGVPMVFARMGLVTGSIVFWGVALLMLATHLLFIDLIARDKQQRRLPGYVGHVLGGWSEKLAIVTHSFHLIGASLAYLILGGEFFGIILEHVLPGVDVLFWQILFWVGGAVTVLSGLKSLSKVESVMTWGLIFVMVLMTAIAGLQIEGPILLNSNWAQSAAGLGIFVFALSGITIMPEIYEIGKRNVRRARLVTIAASLLTAFLTFAFAVAMYLAAGEGLVISSAIALNSIFPPAFGWILPLFGFLAVATSFLATAFDLQAMFQYDMKLSRWWAMSLTLGVPLLLLFITMRDFFTTIDIVGAVFGAANALLVVVAAGFVMRHGKNRPAFWWRVLMPVVTACLFAFVLIHRLWPGGVH
jgi:amino acid permease